MPSVGPSIDRRSTKRFQNLHMPYKGIAPTALICFCCARIHPYMPRISGSQGSRIDMTPLSMDGTHLFGYDDRKMRNFFSADIYRNKYLYKDIEDETLRSNRSAFMAGWTVDFNGVELLCCPEDIQCEQCNDDRRDGCVRTIRSCCLAPICVDCLEDVTGK